LPGCPDILARPLRPVSIFINDDLPTFDLPMKANSGYEVFGSSASDGQLFTNEAELIIIFF
jgi:hypothetical protein